MELGRQSIASLAIVIDLYSRRVVSWSLSTSPDAEMVVKALCMAYEQRGKSQDVVFHADQGLTVHKPFIPSAPVALPDETKHESPWKLLG